MKTLKTIGILLFMSMLTSVVAQNPTANRLNRSLRALTRMQQMMGIEDESHPKIIDQTPVTDIDGNEYKTAKIGNKIWMVENLKVTHYRNGDSISFATDSASWVAFKSEGAYCYLFDYFKNMKHGCLYNYYAISDKRNIAPKGWHVATIEDWNMLTKTLAGVRLEEQGVTEILDDDDKLNLRYTGVREDGVFNGINEFCAIWSSTQCSEEGAWYWGATKSGRVVSRTSRFAKTSGCLVRCVKDEPKVKPKPKPTGKKK